MATFKIACPECGQKVSGDESFLGTVVDCPLCSTKIKFPKEAPPVPDAKPKDAKAPESGEADKDEPSRENPAAPEPKEEAPPSRSTPTPAKAESKSPAAAPILTPSPAATPRSRTVRTSGAAVWSVIFGIAAIIFCPIGILFAVPAVVAGHSARTSILSSFGKIGGQGLATAGLVLGYLYVTIFLASALFVPWKAVISTAEQSTNKKTTTVIVSALTNYATDHDKNFPGALTDLVPAYLPKGSLEQLRYIEPGSLPPEYLDFTYYPGHNTESGPRIILLSAPDADRSYQRLVGYLDGSVEILSEEDFIRQSMKQKPGK